MDLAVLCSYTSFCILFRASSEAMASDDEEDDQDNSSYEDSFIDDGINTAAATTQADDTRTDMMAIYRFLVKFTLFSSFSSFCEIISTISSLCSKLSFTLQFFESPAILSGIFYLTFSGVKIFTSFLLHFGLALLQEIVAQPISISKIA